MTEQSFITCSLAYGCFDPCCDAPCPKRQNNAGPCGVEQGSHECFEIVCPTCTIFQEKEHADKYTNENILREVKDLTDGIFTDLTPKSVGRPLVVVMIGDEGYCYRTSPAFDGDHDSLITCLNYVIEDLEEQKQE
jgi:hypothetical protein